MLLRKFSALALGLGFGATGFTGVAAGPQAVVNAIENAANNRMIIARSLVEFFLNKEAKDGNGFTALERLIDVK